MKLKLKRKLAQWLGIHTWLDIRYFGEGKSGVHLTSFNMFIPENENRFLVVDWKQKKCILMGKEEYESRI